MSEAPVVTSPTLGTTDTSTPAVISTSTASRTNYADNVSTLKSATDNLVPTNNNTSTTTPSTTATSTTPTITINNGTPTNPTTAPVVKPDATKTAPADSTPNPHDVIGYDPTKDSTSSAYDATKDPNSAEYQPASGQPGSLDPVIKQQFDESGAQLDQGINDAKSTLASVTATLQNDPAAMSAVQQITAQYDQLIAAQKAKNDIVMKGYTTSAARTGSLQYANDMTSSFLNDEQNRASERIADLLSKENNAIIKSNTAYKNGDIKAFNDATTALKNAQTAKLNEITKLGTATSNALKDYQAQNRLAQSVQKTQLATDVSKSKNLGASMAEQIRKSGVTDPKQIDAYLLSVAKEFGITNPEILRSAMITAQQTASKVASSNANIASEIANRGKKSTAPGTVKFNAADTTALYGAGETEATIKQLSTDIAQYGAQYVLDHGKLPQTTRTILESKYGLTSATSSPAQQ